MKPRSEPPASGNVSGSTSMLASLFRRLSWRVQAVILAVMAFLLYANTLGHDYALDDGIVITENEYTQKGLAGIPHLLTEDSFAGFLGGDNDLLAGGRYRPLSYITFAIEYSLWGESPGLSHLINTLLYVVCCLLLLRLLRRMLPGQPWWAFLATLIFTFHPLHTEAVANLKGRDELLSFMFLIGAWGLSFRLLSRAQSAPGILASALVLYFLALLSKENGLVFVVVLPVSWYVFTTSSLSDIFRRALPFLLTAVVYLGLRVAVTGFNLTGGSTDVLNHPFHGVGLDEKYATIIYILGKYVGLLFWPHPLAFDYSFQQIPYFTLSNPLIWMLLVLHLGLLTWAAIWIVYKNIFAFGIFFFYISLFLVSNLMINVGAFMGERFLFQGSLGFALILAGGFIWLEHQLKLRSIPVGPWASLGTMGLLLLGYGAKTISRNADWKNNGTLYLQDVQAVPNSAKANKAAAEALISRARNASNDPTTLNSTQQQLQDAVQYLHRALKLHPAYVDAQLDLGTAHYLLDNLDSARHYWKQVEERVPNHPMLDNHYDILYQRYIEEGRTRFREGKRDTGLALIQQAAELEPTRGKAYYMLGLCYGTLGNYDAAVRSLRTAIEANPDNPDYYYNLGGALFTQGKRAAARKAWQKVLELRPDHPEARQALKALEAGGG